jgi:uncharacterized protein (UPF0264 family)
MSIRGTISSAHRTELKKRINTPKLLVSVIDASECAVFSETGFPDYVDLKNPSDGSLGFPSLKTVRDVRRAIPDEIPLSVAIGDAVNDPQLYSKRAVLAAKAGADIVKVGLYDFADDDERVSFLSSIRRSLDKAFFKDTGLVSALYADLYGIDHVFAFPARASAAGVAGCLIDTFNKDGRDIFDYLAIESITKFANACRRNGIFSAIAGGLSVESSKKLADAGVDVIGFRSAVVSNGRGERGLDPERVLELCGRSGNMKI